MILVDEHDLLQSPPESGFYANGAAGAERPNSFLNVGAA